MRQLIIAAFFFSMLCPSGLRASVVVDDPIEKKGTGNENGGPRGSMESVQATATGDELTIDINRYLGNAQVTVMAQDGSSTTANTYYINGHTGFTMDFAGYAEGHYSLTITLQDGQVYSGSFTIE